MKMVTYKKKLKGLLQQYYQNKGFSVVTTDSPEIILFTNKPINKKSVKTSYNYITSFGIKSAEKILNMDVN